MVKVLIIHDGMPKREEKAKGFGEIAKLAEAQVVMAELNKLDVAQLAGYDIILTDLDGTKPDRGNNPDNEKFFKLLSEVVTPQYRPQVRMFSGFFDREPPHVYLSEFPALQDLITTHCTVAHPEVIRSTIAAVIGKPLPEPAAHTEPPLALHDILQELEKVAPTTAARIRAKVEELQNGSGTQWVAKSSADSEEKKTPPFA